MTIKPKSDKIKLALQQIFFSDEYDKCCGIIEYSILHPLYQKKPNESFAICLERVLSDMQDEGYINYAFVCRAYKDISISKRMNDAIIKREKIFQDLANKGIVIKNSNQIEEFLVGDTNSTEYGYYSVFPISSLGVEEIRKLTEIVNCEIFSIPTARQNDFFNELNNNALKIILEKNHSHFRKYSILKKMVIDYLGFFWGTWGHCDEKILYILGMAQVEVVHDFLKKRIDSSKE